MMRFCVTRHLFGSNNMRNNLVNSLHLRLISKTSSNLTVHLTQPKEDNTEKVIYYGPLTPQIKAVKVFSLSSSLAGLVAQPFIYKEAAALGSTGLIIGLCSVVGFFTFVTPLLLHFITKKYVTEITYDEKTSTFYATTITFFLARKKLAFKIEDVFVPDIPGMFTTLHAKGHPLFIEARHFTDPMHYARMMGYDKPMDFKLGNPDSDSTESKDK